MRSLFAAAVLLGTSTLDAEIVIPAKRYTCVSGLCQEVLPISSNLSAGNALDVCSLVCGDGSLWPAPSGEFQISDTVIAFGGFDFAVSSATSSSVSEVLNQQFAELKRKLESIGVRSESAQTSSGSSSSPPVIPVHVSVQDPCHDALRLSTDESYSLAIDAAKSGVTISATTYYGARHALETLSQLVARDEAQDAQFIVATANISDSPKFAYRGVMLDVSRNFLPVERIQSVIQAMAANKLNTLHLHLSDTSSFPMHVPSEPNVTIYGAYSQKMSYSEVCRIFACLCHCPTIVQ